MNVYPPKNVALRPSGFVTTTSMGPAACAGATTRSRVPFESRSSTDGAATPPNETEVQRTKPPPVTTADSPPRVVPIAGSTDTTVGGGGLGSAMRASVPFSVAR
jgi:hypothetical protein